ncbi:MAG: Zn-ribbon domain-containing OB-fold protein, partial [Planctomycetota bacterium]
MFKWFGLVNFSPYTKVGDFAQHLKDGRLMGSRCTKCGETSFPPRADCEACMSGEFELFEMSGKATLHTFTKIVAAPTGFEDEAPYTVGVADLEETGRVLAWIGDTVKEEEIEIGMPLQVVPQI